MNCYRSLLLLDTTLCDKVCKWLATGRCFSSIQHYVIKFVSDLIQVVASPGTPVFVSDLLQVVASPGTPVFVSDLRQVAASPGTPVFVSDLRLVVVSPGTLVFSIILTDCHDIAEILLKVALNTITNKSNLIVTLDNSLDKELYHYTISLIYN